MNPIAVHSSLLHVVKTPASFFVSAVENSGMYVTRGMSGTARSMNTNTVRDRAGTTLQAFGIGTSPRWEA